jgi:hypothetical protein
MNEVTFTLQLRSLDGDALDRAMIQSLEASGYLVTRSPKTPAWETVGEFSRRIGIHPGSFSRRWRLPGLPVVQFECGAGGNRVIRLVATPELEVFMLGAKARDNGSVSLDGLLKAARRYADTVATPEAPAAGIALLETAWAYYRGRRKS